MTPSQIVGFRTSRYNHVQEPLSCLNRTSHMHALTCRTNGPMGEHSLRVCNIAKAHFCLSNVFFCTFWIQSLSAESIIKQCFSVRDRIIAIWGILFDSQHLSLRPNCFFMFFFISGFFHRQLKRLNVLLLTS